MQIFEEELKNGLSTLIVEDRNSPSVTVMALVGVGSRHEGAKKNGLAHFVEHTIFKGTKKRPTSKEIGMDIELLGGNTNAFTAYDYTGFYIKTPSDKYEQALEILADMVQNSVFDEVEINKEKGVVLEEIKMYDDIPRSRISQEFNLKLFGDTGLGRDIAGTKESVSALGKKDLLDFTRENYNGANMLISVAGNVDRKRTLSLVEKHFEVLPTGKKNVNQKLTKRALNGEIYHFDKDLLQNHVVIGGFGYPRDYESRYEYQVGNSLLGYGFGSRLFQVLRDQLGLTYYVNSSLSSYNEIGKYAIGMGVDLKKTAAAINATFVELKNLVNGNFSDEELTRAKNFLVGSLITQLETSDDLASWFGLQILLRERIHSFEEVIEKIRATTKDDVIEIWKQIVTRENMQIAILGPKDDKIIDKIDLSLLD